jgi:TonB family protein
MKKGICFAFFFGLILGLAGGALGAEDLVIVSHLFRGTRGGGAPLPAAVVIVKSFSDPVFLPNPPASFAARAELEFVSAMRADISGVYRLASVDPLSAGRIRWDGITESLMEAIVLDGTLYPIVYHPQKTDRSRINLRIEIFRHSGLSLSSIAVPGQKPQLPPAITSAWGEGEKILDSELTIRLDESVVLGFPAADHDYFLSFQVRRPIRDDVFDPIIKVLPNEESSLASELYLPPKPKDHTTPPYPEKCRQDRIEGMVTLFIRTDESGKVSAVNIWQTAHPDLDRSAVDSLRRWTFEPYLEKGKPIPSSFFMTIDYRLPAAPVAVPPGEGGEKKRVSR